MGIHRKRTATFEEQHKEPKQAHEPSLPPTADYNTQEKQPKRQGTQNLAL